MSRKPFQGVLNILRFNWHQFAIALIIGVLLLLTPYIALKVLGILGLASVLLSLLVSFWVYDASDLYKLKALDQLEILQNSKIINIHSGFDETSKIIKTKLPKANLTIADFYDPKKHTEISISRARNMFPPQLEQLKIDTQNFPFQKDEFDAVFLIFAAHEIRNKNERIAFFKEINRCLKNNGTIVVTEHLRDAANAVAYNIGSIHFHSKKSWLHVFSASNLEIKSTLKTTPFVTTFVLIKNGTSS